MLLKNLELINFLYLSRNLSNNYKIFNLFLFSSLILTKQNFGEEIIELRIRIHEIQEELKELNLPMPEIPELITSANLLRSNEYLSKLNEKKSALLTTFSEYSKLLEELLSSVFEIQNDLKEILKEQSSMIVDLPKPKSNTKTKPKSNTKTKRLKK